MIDQTLPGRPVKLVAGRLAVSGAASALTIFVLCWVAAAIGIAGGHAFIGLFTLAPAASVGALLTGGAAAIAFGGIAGAMFAISYNLTGPRMPR